jgi:hypothetical protein
MQFLKFYLNVEGGWVAKLLKNMWKSMQVFGNKIL